jgi:hypothetical protein
MRPVEKAYMDAIMGLKAMQEWMQSAAVESEVIHHAEVHV